MGHMWMVYTGHLWKHWGWWILLIYEHYFKDGFYQHLSPFLSYLMIVISSQLPRDFSACFQGQLFTQHCDGQPNGEVYSTLSMVPWRWRGTWGNSCTDGDTAGEGLGGYIMIITFPTAIVPSHFETLLDSNIYIR